MNFVFKNIENINFFLSKKYYRCHLLYVILQLFCFLPFTYSQSNIIFLKDVEKPTTETLPHDERILLRGNYTGVLEKLEIRVFFNKKEQIFLYDISNKNTQDSIIVDKEKKVMGGFHWAFSNEKYCNNFY
jgi:hypothetical protein